MGVSEMTRFGFTADDFDKLAQLMADCILRGEAVKEDIQKLRAAHTEMKYCFTDQEVEDAHGSAGGKDRSVREENLYF